MPPGTEAFCCDDAPTDLASANVAVEAEEARQGLH